MNRPHVIIYSDGGADPNPGPGGWGVVLLTERDGKEYRKELSGNDPHTTNNRMELTAAIEALRALKGPCHVEFHTDSQYVRNGITEWMPNWLRNDFKRGKIENSDLWRALNVETMRHEIEWHWVKGHAGNVHNERADALATAQIRALKSDQSAANAPSVRIYLRVSCAGTTGGWAALIASPEGEQILDGGERNTTSNRLDLHAAAAALEQIPEKGAAQVFTASSYLYNGIMQWVPGWKRNNWMKKTGGEVLHRDLWERLDALAASRHIVWMLIPEGERPAEIEQLAVALKQAVASVQHNPES